MIQDSHEFTGSFREYCKKLLEHLQKTNPDRVSTVKIGGSYFMNWVRNNIKHLSFYTSKTGDYVNKLPIVAYYEENDELRPPIFCYLIDALQEMEQ